MTARHVIALVVAVLGTAALGVVITSAIRRIYDWQDRRSYTPPARIHTQIWPAPPAIEYDRPFIGEVVPATAGPQPIAVVDPAATFQPDAVALGILVGLIAQAAQHEAAVQRALYRAPAPIWCQVTAEWELAKAGATA